jgi:DNA-binding response OmpR family regulator
MAQDSSAETRVLLVEDDTNLGTLLREYLATKGYQVQWLKDGKQGLDAYFEQRYDVLILDVMLPEMDGFTLAREIQKDPGYPPILFLTAKNQQEDVLEGFKAGGDDYMTKPFSMEELLMRISALLKRAKGSSPNDRENKAPTYQLGRFQFDHQRQVLSDGQQSRQLSTKEAELLTLLCEYQNQTLPREEALKRVWGDDDFFTARSMDVYITKLRKYLKAEPGVQIMNARGKGYKLLVESE